MEVRPLRGSWVWMGLEAGVPRIGFEPLEGDDGPGARSFWAMRARSKEVHLQIGWGRGRALAEPDLAGTLILNFQPPELGERNVCR